MNRSIMRQRIYAMLTTAMMACFGVTGFASADSITNTGPDSTNTITTTVDKTCDITNDNTVDINGNTEGPTNDQTATSGDVTVTDNTTAGDVTSGDATNTNVESFLVSITNDSAYMGPAIAPAGVVVPVAPLFDACGNPIPPTAGSINTTGPGSTNAITYNTVYGRTGTNTNGVRRSYSNFQRANTGSVFAGANTRVGGAGSGAASNASAPSTTVAVANAPAGGMGGGAPAPAAPTASISNTGPGSDNSISSNYTSDTSITNTNSVSYNSNNVQTSSSGDVTGSGNTTVGGSGSGDASNSNTSGGSVGISN